MIHEMFRTSGVWTDALNSCMVGRVETFDSSKRSPHTYI